MCDKPYTSSDKWTASAISGLLFSTVSSPYTYMLTNSVTEKFGFSLADEEGCPNMSGLVAHSLVYTLSTRLLMNKSHNGCLKPYTSKDKWLVSMISGLLFMLVSSPYLYQSVNGITERFGFRTVSREGCPNVQGLVLHMIVFILITRSLMR